MNNSAYNRKLLVIGNGAISNALDGSNYINSETAKFLLDLAGCGFCLTFIAPQAQYDQHGNLYDFDLRDSGIEALPLPSLRLSRQALLVAFWRLWKAIRRAHYVYVFLPGKLGVLAAHICRALGRPYGVYVRGDNYDSGVFARAALVSSRFALTVSPSIAEDLKGFCRDVEVIRPMLSIDESDAHTRLAMEKSPNTWKLLFVGNISVGKGIPELVSAAKTLSQSGFPFSLTLVGGGALYDDLLNSRASGDLPDCVDVLGVVTDKDALLRLYEEADIFVFPSHSEGFPRVLYEAMIKSLPILTTMVGGIPGRMRHEDNCIGIPVKNPDAIVSELKNITLDLEALNKLGRQGHETVLHVMRTHRSHVDLIVEKFSAYAV